MIYVIDHKDSFTHNVVHLLSLFDDVVVMIFRVRIVQRQSGISEKKKKNAI